MAKAKGSKRSAHQERKPSRAQFEYEKKVRFTKAGKDYLEAQAENEGKPEAELIRERVEAGSVADQIAPRLAESLQPTFDAKAAEVAAHIKEAFGSRLANIESMLASFTQAPKEDASPLGLDDRIFKMAVEFDKVSKLHNQMFFITLLIGPLMAPQVPLSTNMLPMRDVLDALLHAKYDEASKLIRRYAGGFLKKLHKRHAICTRTSREDIQHKHSLELLHICDFYLEAYTEVWDDAFDIIRRDGIRIPKGNAMFASLCITTFFKLALDVVLSDLGIKTFTIKLPDHPGVDPPAVDIHRP